MKKVPLNNGMFALVDDEDFDYVMKRKWTLSPNGYARCCIWVSGKPKTVTMQNYIIEPPSGHIADHRNGKKLNNQKYNLRTCTKSNNAANSRKSVGTKCTHKGVYDSRYGWYVRIKKDGKDVYNKHFSSKKEAIVMHKKQHRKIFGEFSRTK